MFVNFIMKKFNRKDILKLMGLTGIASIGGTFFNRLTNHPPMKPPAPHTNTVFEFIL